MTIVVAPLERFEPRDEHDARLVAGATGLLGELNRAGVLTSADVHAAGRLGVLVREEDEAVVLALALTVRAARHGSVCLDLLALCEAEAATGTADLPWPEPAEWLARVAASTTVTAQVLRVAGPRLYLDRYWREELLVRDTLTSRLDAPPPALDLARATVEAERLFPGPDYREQREAALASVGSWTTVLTGGPGTGKTTTVAGVVAVWAALAEAEGRLLRVALAAPTGKAAARMLEAVQAAAAVEPFTDADRARLAAIPASTLHRLLGWRPDSRTRFRHHRRNRLPHDVIVVDETSMVSLTMMARLLEAVRPDTRLLLVGDPDQLASVEAGAVLADLVDGWGRRPGPSPVVSLRTPHRFDGAIRDLAEAFRSGDDAADRVLDVLRGGGADAAVELVDPEDAGAAGQLRARLLDHATRVREAALAGDAAEALRRLDQHRLLCAHRDGPYGARHWNRLVERLLSDAAGQSLGESWGREWYAGRPVIVTANDHGLDLFNGDTGVVVAGPADRLEVALPGVPSPRRLATSRLQHVDTLHAMTVHKSQGSQAAEVTVLLPPPDSPLLTRELFYTAVTRATTRVRVVGTEEAVRAAVTRRAQRASGLADRIAEPSGRPDP